MLLAGMIHQSKTILNRKPLSKTICLITIATVFSLNACHNPDKGLNGAQKGMQTVATNPPVTDSDDNVDPALIREIVTETGSTIEPGDEIDISVLQDEKLNGLYKIDNDGGFQWHYIGRVKTDSLTTNDLRRKLTEVVSKFINEPSVTINYKTQQPRTIRVIGETKQQGHFPLTHNMRLIDGITEAGGLTDNANQKEIILIRSVSDKEIRAGLFNYREATLNPLGGEWVNNVTLQTGDTIFVPKSGKAQWEAAIAFIDRLANAGVGIERGIVLYPDIESVISSGDNAGRNTIVVR